MIRRYVSGLPDANMAWHAGVVAIASANRSRTTTRYELFGLKGCSDVVFEKVCAGFVSYKIELGHRALTIAIRVKKSQDGYFALL